MAGSTRRQYEANPFFKYTTRTGNTGPSCPLGIALFDPGQESKFLIFGQCRRWIRKKRQYTVNFDVLSFPVLEINFGQCRRWSRIKAENSQV